MAYPDRLLNDNETVSVDLHPHWWFLTGPIVVMTSGITGMRRSTPAIVIATACGGCA